MTFPWIRIFAMVAACIALAAALRNTREESLDASELQRAPVHSPQAESICGPGMDVAFEDGAQTCHCECPAARCGKLSCPAGYDLSGEQCVKYDQVQREASPVIQEPLVCPEGSTEVGSGQSGPGGVPVAGGSFTPPGGVAGSGGQPVGVAAPGGSSAGSGSSGPDDVPPGDVGSPGGDIAGSDVRGPGAALPGGAVSSGSSSPGSPVREGNDGSAPSGGSGGSIPRSSTPPGAPGSSAGSGSSAGNSGSNPMPPGDLGFLGGDATGSDDRRTGAALPGGAGLHGSSSPDSTVPGGDGAAPTGGSSPDTSLPKGPGVPGPEGVGSSGGSGSGGSSPDASLPEGVGLPGGSGGGSPEASLPEGSGGNGGSSPGASLPEGAGLPGSSGSTNPEASQPESAGSPGGSGGSSSPDASLPEGTGLPGSNGGLGGQSPESAGSPGGSGGSSSPDASLPEGPGLPGSNGGSGGQSPDAGLPDGVGMPGGGGVSGGTLHGGGFGAGNFIYFGGGVREFEGYGSVGEAEPGSELEIDVHYGGVGRTAPKADEGDLACLVGCECPSGDEGKSKGCKCIKHFSCDESMKAVRKGSGELVCEGAGSAAREEEVRRQAEPTMVCPDNSTYDAASKTCIKPLEQCPEVVETKLDAKALACGPRTVEYIDHMFNQIHDFQAVVHKEVHIERESLFQACSVNCISIYSKFSECAEQDDPAVCAGRAGRSGKVIRAIGELSEQDNCSSKPYDDLPWLRKTAACQGGWLRQVNNKFLPCRDMYGSEFNFKSNWAEVVSQVEGIAIGNFIRLSGEYVDKPFGHLQCREAYCSKVDTHGDDVGYHNLGGCLQYCIKQWRW